MKYNLLRFQTSGGLIIFFSKDDFQVLISLMKENKRYKRLKTAKWISIRKLVSGLLLTSDQLVYCASQLLNFVEHTVPSSKDVNDNLKAETLFKFV